MTHTYSIKGIMCNGCAGHVKEQLEKHPDVTSVDLPKIAMMNLLRRPKKAVISMNQHISLAELQRFLEQDSEYAGRYSIIEPEA
ncbi:MAG: heavy-metal-associated domain-containing protein [Flavobacteriales bacterium]|nr:heavy-metal-associated domain-containing protein [Flavobacteriales bacterium]